MIFILFLNASPFFFSLAIHPHQVSREKMKNNKNNKKIIVHVLCSLMPLERDVLEISTLLALG